MRKYPKLRYPNHKDAAGLLAEGNVVVQEKLDGANFRFKLDDDGSILWGTRNTVQPKEIEESNKQFRHAIRYLYRTIDFEALAEIEESEYHGDLVFYGESMHKHSIDYDAWDGRHPTEDEDVPNVIIFDVWCGEHEGFLSHEEMEEVCAAVGLETAPVLFEGPADECPVEDLKAAESAYRTPDEGADNDFSAESADSVENEQDSSCDFDAQGLAEGVVIKNQRNGAMAKLVHPKFKEKNAVAFNDKKKAQREGAGEAAVFVAAYVTDARIAKTAHKLVDEGDYDGLCMEMMEDLPRAVLIDAVEEEAWDLLTNEVDLTEDSKKQIRRLASKKCVSWLKAELQSI